MDKPKIVFISGLSGTGKSILVNYFMENPLSGWLFYDFDKGKYKIPIDNEKHLAWRKKQTAWWLRIAHKEVMKKKAGIVVLGLSLYPRSALELASAKLFDKENIHFALIHCEPEQRKERIMGRGTPHHWRGHQPWYDEFYREMTKSGAFTIDTTNKSVKQTANDIKKWLIRVW